MAGGVVGGDAHAGTELHGQAAVGGDRPGQERDQAETDLARLAALSPVRQVFSDMDFVADMANPAIVKFVSRDLSGAICALSTLTNDLTTQPWLSPEYYEARYPIQMAEGRIYYVGSLLVMPEHQGGPWAHMLLASVIRWLAARRAIATFDCCSFNVDDVQLPRLIATVARREAVGTLEELGRQHFYALVLDGGPASRSASAG